MVLPTEAGPGGSTEQLGQDLLSLFQQHQRLLDLAAAGKGGAKGKAKPEGLTQVGDVGSFFFCLAELWMGM